MKRIIKLLSIMLAVVLLCSVMVFAEEKTPTVMVDNKNAVIGEVDRIAITVENFDNLVGGYNFEIKFPEIVQITNVYLNGIKLTSLSDGGSDYNIRSGNRLVLAGTCNYGNENDLDDNTVYQVEFSTVEDAVIGEYPVEFTDNTFIVSDSADEELIYPDKVNGIINLTQIIVDKADINESGASDATDMTILKKWLIGADYGTVFNKIAADVNDDGTLDIRDLIAIKKHLSQTDVSQTKTLPDTGGMVETLNGGAKAEATALRNAINTASDTVSVTGAKYYISNNGSDSNDGRSPETAFKTLEKVSGIGLGTNDAVFLERGSVFRLASAIILKNGVTYAAYGQGEKPAVYGSQKNYASKSLWGSTGTENVWRMSFFKSDAGIIVLNGGSETGKKQMNLKELTVNNDFYHDWEGNTLYFYCDKGNPGEVFSEIEIGVKERLFHLREGAHDIKIDNIDFKYSGIFGIRSEGEVYNITVTNCAFSWIGGCLFDNKSNRYGNAIEFADGCENILVKNCSFDQIFDSGVTFQLGNKPYRNFTVENCLFEYNGMSGFEWWALGDDSVENGVYTDLTVIEDIKFNNNIVRLTGYGWSKATRSPAHIRAAWKNKIYPNLKNFTISGNIFDCVNGQIIASCWETPPETYTVSDNTYYQSFIKNSKNGMYLPFTSIDGQNQYVTNYEEFIWAVVMNDESPRKIEWIESLN